MGRYQALPSAVASQEGQFLPRRYSRYRLS